VNPSLRLALVAAAVVGLSACRIEQRVPAGLPREQAAILALVSSAYDSAGAGRASLLEDQAFARQRLVPVLVRADVQIQRDLASVWATVRLRKAGAAPGRDEPVRVQHLLLRHVGAGWFLVSVATSGS
jgi:hypothetical protein